MAEEFKCRRCGSTLNMSDDQEVEFTDETSGATITVTQQAAWCSECSWTKVVVV